MNLVCNYAVARFMPYAHTEEFVNIGVVLHCEATGYLDFRLTTKRSRVNQFFPELNHDLLLNAVQSLKQDLRFMQETAGSGNAQQLVIREVPEQGGMLFREIIRSRESIIRFSTPRTVLARDPAVKLQEIFNDQIERRFAHSRDYHEKVMTHRLRKTLLRTGALGFFKEEKLGNEHYSVNLPFVYRRGERLDRGIKPLDLDKESSTKIIEHGGLWIGRMERLRSMHCWPENFLFVIKEPSDQSGSKRDAAREIEGQLKRMDTQVIPFSHEREVIDFARVA